MSLLNDALKRASQSQQGHDTVRITLPPAEPAAKTHGGPGSALSTLVILLIAAAGVSIAIAFLFFGMKGKIAPHSTATATVTKTTTAAVPPQARAVPNAPKPAHHPTRTRAVAVAAHTPAPRYAPTPVPVPVPTPMPMATLKLQGITYYNGKWQAIVNGTTVYVGDNVDGFRVAQISQNHVSFIAPDGSRRLVPMGQ